MTQKTLMLYTGGTIGMVASDHGYIADAKLPSSLRQKSNFAKEDFDCISLEPLIDSALMSVAKWQQILDAIAQHFDPKQHRGIIILHGTDTLAYTAAMLSFWQARSPVPIIITGAMRSIHDDHSDGWSNIALAFKTIRDVNQGVWVTFADEVLHAARVSKFNANADNAFAAPNGNRDFRTSDHYLTPPAHLENYRVRQLNLTPFSHDDELIHIAQPPSDALLLGVYGSGTVPNLPQGFAALQEANQTHLLTAAATQSAIGKLNVGKYEASNAIMQANCRSASDMTREAALVKLFYLCHLPLSHTEKQALIETDLVGEL